ncbi:hypothetical protein [Wolbachia endosymbiont of Aedes albopictus]|nr:hypothetical protein [Wolbachia endosymbiont of Aedes albopictus]UVW84188.1 hypothetical protein NHG98_01585 [Wolbachia endosymbiont of Aedes albopictus]
MSATCMTPPATCKLQCLYDCASRAGMTKKSELLVFYMVMQGV